MSDYVLWQHDTSLKNAISINRIANFENEFRLHEGIPLSGDFPEDVQLRMHPDRPRNTIPTDSLFNTDRVVLASPRLTEFLKEYGLKEVEYLQATVVDVKGKPTKDPYFIVNTLKNVDCLDRDASGVTYSVVVPEDIDEVERIVLDESRIDASRELFRLANYADHYFASRKLAEAVREKGFTGIRFTELEDFEP